MQIVHYLQGLHMSEFMDLLFFMMLVWEIGQKNAEQMLPFSLKLTLGSS